MDMMKFIPEHLVILIVALGVIGTICKSCSNQKIPDWTIPWILLVLGIIGSIALQKDFSALSIIQGILCAGVTILGSQLYIQTVKKRPQDGLIKEPEVAEEVPKEETPKTN